MIREIDRVGREVEADDEVRVGVSQRRPGLLHRACRRRPDPAMPTQAPPKPTELGGSTHGRALPHHAEGHDRADRGRRRGGGSELVLSLDMRFGAIGRAVLASRRSRSASFPAGAAHSGCRAWSAARARSRSSSAAPTSRRARRALWLGQPRVAAGRVAPFVDARRPHRVVPAGGGGAGEGRGQRRRVRPESKACSKRPLLQPDPRHQGGPRPHGGLHGSGRADLRSGEGRVVLKRQPRSAEART